MQQNINMGIHHVDLVSPISTELNAAKNNNESAEREEGEIIEDEFEDIISSDEELSMRKRIEELEARNAELEKIANISGIYNYEMSSKKDACHINDRNPLATIDLSDLDDYPSKQIQSSISFANNNKQNCIHHNQKSTIKSSISYPKRDTHRGHNQYNRYEISENYNFISSRRNSSNKSRRQSSSPELKSRSVSPVQKTRIKKQQRNNRSGGGGGAGTGNSSRSRSRKKKSVIKTVQSSKKSTTTNTVYEDLSSSEDEEFCALNRNELRLALKRDTNTTLVPNRGNFQNSVNLDKRLFSTQENNKSMQEQQPEKLESQILNNQTLANETTVQKIDGHISSDDSVSLEEQELRLIALKSAVVKKHLARKKRKENEEKKPYSPSDFDNIKITPSPNNCDTIGTGNSMDISPIASPELLLSDNDENTKPIDMDLVNSSDSDEPIFVGQHWLPIQEIPLPKELNDIKPPTPILIHSPQPRKLLNNEETLEFINSLIDPIEIVTNNDKIPKGNKEMDIINDEENTKIIISSVSSPEPTDEEELALRTLLLAKMNNNSPKVNKNNLLLRNPIENNSPKTDFLQIDNNCSSSTKHSNQSNDNVACSGVGEDDFNVVENEVDALRNLILNTMRPNHKTESVLKEAVRRLKNSTNEIAQYNDIVPTFDNYLQSYEEELFTNSIPDNINIQNYNNLPEIVDSQSYLGNIENSIYDQQQQQQPSYFEQNNFQLMPNVIPNISIHKNSPTSDNRDPIRPALKVIPIKELTKCREKSINILKNPQLNDNLIEVPIKNVPPIINQNFNLKEIPLKLNNSIVRIEENYISTSDSQELISKIQENLPIQENIIVENCRQSEQSLEITKKIESLKKLSNTIQQTTEISMKSRLPLARKSAPQLLVQNPRAGTVVTKKIVNANKVINQSIVNKSSTVLKRKISTIQHQQNDDIIKKSRITLSSHLNTTTITPTNKLKTSNSNNLSRLVTNIEMPTVKQLIINIGNSSATDDDTEEDEFFEIGNQNSATIMENKYYDNASPMSVQLDSPYYSPNPSTYSSPCPSVNPVDKVQIQIDEVKEDGENCRNDVDGNEEIEENLKKNEVNDNVIVGKSVVNDVFQAKLDQFLKNARTKVESVKKAVDVPIINDEIPVVVSQINPVTPLSVRHLPESSQMEYRRLVNRMKILEKQKQAKKTNNLTNFQVTITNDKATTLSNQINAETLLVNIKKTITNDMATSSKLPDDSLIRKVLIKNTTVPVAKPETTTTIVNESTTNSTIPKIDIKPKKSDLLQKYETAYHKNGSLILDNIDKALTLVNQGKEAKCKKLLVQERMAELSKEMENCKNILKIQADKIAKIYPDIINIHKIIGNSKSRRIKLEKATINLGKTLNGDVYHLDDINNQEIAEKFKNLSVEIKTLKNLKLNDIKNDNTNLNNVCDKNIVNIEKRQENSDETNPIDNNCRNDNEKIDIIENEIKKVDNTNENIRNVIDDNPPINNDKINESNNLNSTEICAITLKDVTTNLDNNSKLVVSHIEDKVQPENNDEYVHPEAENLETCSENVAENIPPEIMLERNIPTLKTVLNQKDELPTKRFHYTSPLDYKNDERQLNPNDIICPYQLMGQCDDKDCKYGHLLNIGTSKVDAST